MDREMLRANLTDLIRETKRRQDDQPFYDGGHTERALVDHYAAILTITKPRLQWREVRDGGGEIGAWENGRSKVQGVYQERAVPNGGRWFLGAMNDGLFILDGPPSPSGTDVPPGVYANDPDPIIALGDMPIEKAQAIVDAHNREIT